MMFLEDRECSINIIYYNYHITIYKEESAIISIQS